MGEARIELELVTESGFPITGSQQWTYLLKDLKLARLRIRSQAGSLRPSIERLGTADAPMYRVTGVLTARNQLRLRGGTFGLHDKARLKEWIRRLSEGGVEGLTATQAAFGLTSKQLAAVRGSLAAKVRDPTQGQRVEQVLAAVTGELTLQTVMAPSAREMIKGGPPVADELVGVTRGTALAAVLRPVGLALVPEKPNDGPVRLRVTPAGRASESWPVGWPAEKKAIELLPKLFERLEVEIVDTPLAEVLEAIQQRLDVPLLLDHNSLARRKIDPGRVQVSFSNSRTYYKRILDEAMRQARLRAEIRVDEAGRPLLWISTP
jgi:hypothetical protein